MQHDVEVGLGDAPSDATAQAYFANACAFAAFADTASVRFGKPDREYPDTSHLPAAHAYVRMFLLAQGIELAVKSWLIQRGATAEEVKAHSHWLKRLLTAAGAAGFPFAGAAELYLTESLDRVYAGTKRLQYPLPAVITWPSPLAVRELLHDALMAACATIHPQFDLAAQPGVDDRYWTGLRIEPDACYAGRSLVSMRRGVPTADGPAGGL
jgi:hypothetical protein